MSSPELLLFFVVALMVVLIGAGWGRRRQGRRRKPEHDPYTEALRFLVDGEVDLAYTRLVESVRADTSRIDAYILLGDILRQRGNIDRAIKVHRDVTIRTDLSEQQHAVVLRSLARDYIVDRRWEEAARVLRDLERLVKGDRWARLRLIEVFEAQQDWSAAFESARQIEHDPEVGGTRLAGYLAAQAGGLFEAHQFHRARLMMKDALKFDPRCTEAYLMIGDSYAAEGRTGEAVAWWEKLVDAVPEHAPEAFKRLEDSLYELGSFERIAEIYQRHLQANPNRADAVLAMANLLVRKGELQRAIDLIHSHRPRCDEPIRLDRQLVRLYHQIGRTEEALSLALKVAHEVESAPAPPAGEGVTGVSR